MDRDELLFYLGLSLTPGIGARRAVQLREYFGDACKAHSASQREFERIAGFGASTAQAFIDGREAALDDAREQLERATDTQSIVTYFDEAYPAMLKSIYDPPALLFVDGNVELMSAPRQIAVIGSRRVTDYGKRTAHTISEELASEGVTIVSGFAKGVDTIAHRAAFDAGGKTIAVLGSGVDVVYPSGNKQFAQELIESGRGVIVSELPFGAPPDAKNFPWRNRIVSGMSNGVVVIESDEKGGSLITATLALDQNREVFAVPGDIGRAMCAGTNALIRESRAKLVRSARDIMVDMQWAADKPSRKRVQARRTDLSMFQNLIVDVLEQASEPLHIDVLSERSSLKIEEIHGHLLMLELEGVVRQLAGKQFMLV